VGEERKYRISNKECRISKGLTLQIIFFDFSVECSFGITAEDDCKKKTDDSSWSSVSALPLPRFSDNHNSPQSLPLWLKNLYLPKGDTNPNLSTFEQILAVHSDNFAGFDACKLSFFLCQSLCSWEV